MTLYTFCIMRGRLLSSVNRVQINSLRLCNTESPASKDNSINLSLDRILRVDHAGEYGAQRIYEGQLAFLSNTPAGPEIKEMYEQELGHLKKFESLIPRHRARPSALLPVWHVAGYMLGAGTAMLGTKAAMTCTAAVEEVIVDHYESQIRQLTGQSSNVTDDEKEILETLSQFRDEELEHKHIALDHNPLEETPYQVLSEMIKVGCKGAIWLAERI